MPTRKRAASSRKNHSVDLAADRKKLVEDLKILMEDAKVLTADASTNSKEFAHETAEQLKEQLNEAIEALKSQGQAFRETATEKSEELEDILREHPWKTLGIGILVGVILDRLTRK